MIYNIYITKNNKKKNMNYMNRLPIELVYKIMAYSYNVQAKSLLDDICDYPKSKNDIIDKYYVIWSMYYVENNLQHLFWVQNAIYSFYNRGNPTSLGYNDHFYGIISRLITITNNSNVASFIRTINNRPVQTQINILWGLLTIDERKQMSNIISFTN